MYCFVHPEPYHLRPLDPLLVILGCSAILSLRERVKEASPAPILIPVISLEAAD
jgi:hypothetical protein